MNALAATLFVLCYAKFLVANYLNRSVEFSIILTRNETGHWFSDVSLDRITPKPPNNWRLNLRHKITENAGNHSYHLFGSLSVLPPRPSDYELFPGVGYYKFHHDMPANSFDDAVDRCAHEGGHLAIINSEEEANVMRILFERNSPIQEWAFIGFDGRTKGGLWQTIFGDPLATTGYTKWMPNKPDFQEEASWCGSVNRNALISNTACNQNWPFICEYGLYWQAS